MPHELCAWCDDHPRPATVTFGAGSRAMHLCATHASERRREVHAPRPSAFRLGFDAAQLAAAGLEVTDA